MSHVKNRKVRRRSRRTCRVLTTWRVEERVAIPDGVAATPQEVEAAVAEVYAGGGEIVDAKGFVRGVGLQNEAAILLDLMEPDPAALEAVVG